MSTYRWTFQDQDQVHWQHDRLTMLEQVIDNDLTSAPAGDQGQEEGKKTLYTLKGKWGEGGEGRKRGGRGEQVVVVVLFMSFLSLFTWFTL